MAHQLRLDVDSLLLPSLLRSQPPRVLRSMHYAWALSKNKSSRQKIPDIERWKPADLPHTHRALDDAIEQGATFMGAWMENTSST